MVGNRLLTKNSGSFFIILKSVNLLRIASRLLSERTSLFLISSRLVLGSRKDDALKKFPQFEKETELFEERDPARNLKYLDWELKILNSGQALAPEICDVVDLFHKYKANLKKHDLKQYDDFTELRDTLFGIEESRKNKKKKVDDRYKLNDSCETDTVYEKDGTKVLLIKNKAASVHHGLGTKWCISMKSHGYFDDYSSSNTVFFFVLNSSSSDLDQKTEKFALSYQRDKSNKISKLEIFDSSDKIISKSKFNELIPNGSEILFETEQIAKLQPKSILAKLANDEATSEEIIKSYEWTKTQNSENSESTLKLILESSKTPSEILTELSHSEDKYIQRIVLLNSNMPVDILIELSHSEDKNIRNNIAQNLNTPPEILTKLSHDNDKNVRSSVASNPSTPIEVLIELYHDKKVDSFVASNPRTPVEILTELSKISNWNIQNSLARNPSTPSEILIELSKTKIDGFQRVLARNPNTPISVLTELSRNVDYEIRKGVAENPNTPVEILTYLINDENELVQSAAQDNPNYSPNN